jgi:hypothetical protein
MDMQITKPKSFCFVLMPFATELNDIYEFGIKGACENIGVYCERVDDQIFPGSMLDRIYNQIARADLLVAEMTGRNPNVFYEVGYAHALGKHVILLTQKAEDIPFDLKHFPHIVYANIKELRSELAKRVEFFAYSAPTAAEGQIALDLYVDQQSLSKGVVTHFYEADAMPSASLTIHNSSSRTYRPGEFRLGVVAPSPYSVKGRLDVVVTELPDGTYLHMLPDFETLFPGAYLPAEFYLDTVGAYRSPVDLVLKVFTDAGYRDFPLRLKSKNVRTAILG